jgi:hypothetical protein
MLRSLLLRLLSRHLIPILWISGALTAAIFIGFRFVLDLPAGAPSVLALQLAFSEGTFRDIIDEWGAAGVDSYRASMCLDMLFPAVYATFLTSLLIWLEQRHNADRTPGPVRRAAFWLDVLNPFRPRGAAWLLLPVIAALGDYVENVLHLIILADTSSLSAALILLASLAAAIKWALLAVIVGRAGVLLLRASR